MKKMMMTLAAVLCCAMTTSVFTACGGDDDTPDSKLPESPQPTEKTVQVPTTARVQFYVENTADMLKYLDIVVKCSDGEKEYASQVLTRELVDDSYTFKTNVFVSKLPAQFKVWREIKVKEAFKDSVNNLERFDYTSYIPYYYGVYDADNNIIGKINDGRFGSIYSSDHQNNEMVRNFFSKFEQLLCRTYELNFDKNGIMSKK